MPRGDATGPFGKGPGTGWGKGPCGAGFGWGRRMFGFGQGHSFGWGHGFGSRFGAWGTSFWGRSPTKKDQQKILSEYIQALENDLADAKDELKSLLEE